MEGRAYLQEHPIFAAFCGVSPGVGVKGWTSAGRVESALQSAFFERLGMGRHMGEVA